MILLKTDILFKCASGIVRYDLITKLLFTVTVLSR